MLRSMFRAKNLKLKIVYQNTNSDHFSPYAQSQKENLHFSDDGNHRVILVGVIQTTVKYL